MTLFRKILNLALISTLLLVLTTCSSDDPEPGGNGNTNLNRGAVGSSANDLLSAANYRTLQVEIQYTAGHAPPQSSITYIQNFLNDRLYKPGGITVNISQTEAPGQDTYTLEEIRQIEDESRNNFTSGNNIAVYFYFSDGNYADDANVLGIAHRNTSMVIFQKRIEELSGGFGQVSTAFLTSAVMAHEIGHLLGLVNTGSEMQNAHQDSANGAHCDNDQCLMYYAVGNAGGISDMLGMNNPPDLDANCLADLAANGGK